MKVIKFKNLYNKWCDVYFDRPSRDSSVRTITSAHEYCRKLDNMKLKDIGVEHLKDCMEAGMLLLRRGRTGARKDMLLTIRSAKFSGKNGVVRAPDRINAVNTESRSAGS